MKIATRRPLLIEIQGEIFDMFNGQMSQYKAYLLRWIGILSIKMATHVRCVSDSTYQKVKDLKLLIEKYKSKALIEIDGGVNSENATKLTEQGADVLVAGSFVFKSDNPTNTISTLSTLIN